MNLYPPSTHPYNKVYVGILAGLILPFVGYAILLMIYDFLDNQDIISSIGMSPNFRERTIGLIALILNAIPMQIFSRRYWQDAMRGVVFPTLAYVIIWMYLYGFELLKF
ncbi:MAG: hypothetical protein KA251_09535 [Saprospiraceae bacterium]|nr:hypothetical protein [Candidatus Vicinibacter affinis]MBP6173795.1 hypothetical protein [Saprospiraceae bacterium]MBK6572277.1 hypothetical protein [Candidatus Vicinibacter affinis]MBK6824249.1 hypothetical protein [Candidatus Vicinibacter affinis]MBK7303865.1 hypothetical protein [Candidatus Vicinibacter affinis]